MSEDEFVVPNVMPVETPSIATPSQEQGLTPILIDDIVEPRYPLGCELWIMRPGELVPVVKVPIQHGCMLAAINPEQSVHVRAQIRATLAAIQAAQRRKAESLNGVGRRGR